MQIDPSSVKHLRVQFERFMSLSFPEMPESDELGRCAAELLTLDPAIAAKIISAVNGNFDVIDLRHLEDLLSDLSLLEAKLGDISADQSEIRLVSEYRNYVSVLLGVGRILVSVLRSDVC
jgi:hypothetical protein